MLRTTIGCPCGRSDFRELGVQSWRKQSAACNRVALPTSWLDVDVEPRIDGKKVTLIGLTYAESVVVVVGLVLLIPAAAIQGIVAVWIPIFIQWGIWTRRCLLAPRSETLPMEFGRTAVIASLPALVLGALALLAALLISLPDGDALVVPMPLAAAGSAAAVCFLAVLLLRVNRDRLQDSTLRATFRVTILSMAALTLATVFVGNVPYPSVIWMEATWFEADTKTPVEPDPAGFLDECRNLGRNHPIPAAAIVFGPLLVFGSLVLLNRAWRRWEDDLPGLLSLVGGAVVGVMGLGLVGLVWLFAMALAMP